MLDIEISNEHNHTAVDETILNRQPLRTFLKRNATKDISERPLEIINMALRKNDVGNCFALNLAAF